MSVPTRRLLDSNGVDVVGEVQATPTSNTLLRRLKDIVDAVGSISTTNAITTIVQAEISVSTGSTAVLSANADRLYALFQNDSDEEIYIYLGATAVMNKGIRLSASGGSYEITSVNLYTGVVTAICATGTKNLLVTQGV